MHLRQTIGEFSGRLEGGMSDNLGDQPQNGLFFVIVERCDLLGE